MYEDRIQNQLPFHQHQSARLASKLVAMTLCSVLTQTYKHIKVLRSFEQDRLRMYVNR
jgi:hypothetical protein